MQAPVNPLFSIIIPTYKHGHLIGRALQSVIDQTYKNWETIVIDNHSKDNTDEVIASFADPRITYLKIQNNGVIAASRNAGIRASKGDWIAFLDSDDWWTADKLQVCFDCVNDKVDFVNHDMEIVSDQPRLFRRKIIKSWQVKPPVLMDLLLKNVAIVNSSVVVRKKMLERIGGINESAKMITAEDYNAWLRIAQITDQFVYLSRKLGYHLIHNQSESSKDMSISTRCAVAEFIPALSDQQKYKLEANLRYIKGRYNYLAGNFMEAKDNLLFALHNGNIIIRLKVLTMIKAWL